MPFRTLNDYQLSNKRVLIRVDLNVPLENGIISDSSRIERAIPTIKEILKNGGKPILMSHFGRPKGLNNSSLSMEFLIPYLSKYLGCKVKFSKKILGAETLD